MLFKKKIDRALEYNKERLRKENGKDNDEKLFYSENKDNVKLEKGDTLALILSGFYVLAPIFIIIILIVVLVSFL